MLFLLVPCTWLMSLQQCSKQATAVCGAGCWCGPLHPLLTLNFLTHPFFCLSCLFLCFPVCINQYVFLEEPQRFNAALFRTTAPYLPAGLADKLIHSEEQQRLTKLKEQQQHQQAGMGAVAAVDNKRQQPGAAASADVPAATQ